MSKYSFGFCHLANGRWGPRMPFRPPWRPLRTRSRVFFVARPQADCPSKIWRQAFATVIAVSRKKKTPAQISVGVGAVRCGLAPSAAVLRLCLPAALPARPSGSPVCTPALSPFYFFLFYMCPRVFFFLSPSLFLFPLLHARDRACLLLRCSFCLIRVYFVLFLLACWTVEVAGMDEPLISFMFLAS
jgi:hypothetical protein